MWVFENDLSIRNFDIQYCSYIGSNLILYVYVYEQKNKTPLHLAAEKKHTDVMTMLFEAKTDLSLKDNVS